MENGKINRLEVARKDDKGFYLKDKKGQEIHVPAEDLKGGPEPGDTVDVFIYKDRSRLVSGKLPYAQVEEFAFLKVKKLTDQGAYADWGLDRDLFVPLEEQMEELKEGGYYVFYIFEDEDTGAIRGSHRIEDFLFFEDIDVGQDDQVDLLLYRESQLGVNVIVNNLFQGLIFKSDIHKNIKVGDRISGFVKQVRKDGKIDVVLEPPGYKKSITSNTELLMQAIREADGFLSLTDKSKPEEIKQVLGISKKAFKRAAGHLYKNKLIEIRSDGMHLVKVK